MELRHLTTFRTVAQLQSFRRAAEALGYVQGNVTILGAENSVTPYLIHQVGNLVSRLLFKERTMKILAIYGGSRKNGNSEQLTKELLKGTSYSSIHLSG